MIDAPPDGAASAFFASAMAAYGRAVGRGGDPVDRCYRIGRQTIRFRFANHTLVPAVAPAIEHLRTDPSDDPALTICLWDSRSTDVPMPPPPWPWESTTIRGEIELPAGEGLFASIQPEFCGLNLLHLARRTAMYWVRDARLFPSHEHAEPLLRTFHWWFRAHGCHLVHGGAVGTAGGGVLLAGKGGAGKSNTALSCAVDGMTYAGDDYCLFSLDTPPTIFGLYRTAKLDSADVGRFPALAGAIANPGRVAGEKAVYVLNGDEVPIVRELALRAICVLRISGGLGTSVEPAPKRAAFLAIAPNTICQLPDAGSEAIAAVSRLVRTVPCYYLNVGSDPAQRVAAVRSILGNVAPPAAQVS
jgi:hypothetical protein